MKIPQMRIPVFVSAPSHNNLSPRQQKSAEIIYELVERYKLEWRALGRSDYPTNLPLREVLRMVRHCSGGIILGFEQFQAQQGIWKKNSPNEKIINESVFLPTPWNQIESGILFSTGVPVIIFKEEGVSGGVFDLGISEVYIHKMPDTKTSSEALDDLDSAFQNWAANVRKNYYGD